MADNDLPIEVNNSEMIIRFVLSPVHINTKKNELKISVFRPKDGDHEVSVARLVHLGADGCKAKAKELESEKVKYSGLARICAADIRKENSEVYDARAGYYVGHAHVSHGIIVPKDDPPDAEIKKQLEDRIRALLKHTTYFPRL